MINIIYSTHYLNYSFGPDHPFWPERAKIFLALLQKSKLSFKIKTPKKGKEKDVLLVHSKKYLNRLIKLSQVKGYLSIDTPLNNNVLDSAFWSVGGSILSCKLATKKKRSINLLGGLHHAGKSQGSGFCIFNDHSIAIKKLQKQKLIKKAIIYDLDVHAGQGTQEIFYNDQTVYTISLHQDPKTLYPGIGFPEQIGKGKGRGFNRNVIFSPGTGEKEYLEALDTVLSIYQSFKPDLVCLVLGTDTYKNDPLASLKLDKKTFFKIGKKFAKFKKLAVFCAGGYSKKTPYLWLEFLKGLNEKK